MPDVDTLFLEELARRGVVATRDADGNYSITQGTGTNTVSLANLKRDVARDNDLGRISNFVDTILSVITTPSWDEAKPWVRWQLESLDGPVGEALHDKVSDQVALVLVLASPDETQIRWISESTAVEWGQTKETLFTVAADNIDAMVAKAEITFEPIDGHKLGMIVTEWAAYKAALLYAPGLKAKVEPVLGWPVFAVMPCRDFVYLVPEADKEFLPRMGAVVAKEYQNGAYPLSTEVFEVRDEGIRAAFEFQRPPTAPKKAGGPEPAEEPGWRTIQYADFLRFRVPDHWAEEYSPQGTEYFDPAGPGRLHVTAYRVDATNAVTDAHARQQAEEIAARNGGIAMARDHRTWLVWLVESPAQEVVEGEPRTAWAWNLVTAVPPIHVYNIAFQYVVPTATLAADPERVERERLMVRQEAITAFLDPKPAANGPKPAKSKPKLAPAAKPKRDKGDKN